MPSDRGADARVLTRSVGTGPEVLARVSERVRALRAVDHPGVLVPIGVGVAEGDQVVVTLPWIDGVDLAELETRRGPLTAGECVWLGVRVAAALDALHARGIAHGDVAPANIVIAGGEVVIVDTVGGCLDDERGTVGFRAPERRSGSSLAADAYSLGALLRWCVAAHDSVAVEAWTAPLIAHDPDARPPVAVAARALASCAPPRPVAVPSRTEVVGAVRARASEGTERIAAGRAWRMRRVALRTSAGLAVAAAAVAGIVAAPRVVDATMSSVTTPAAAESAPESPLVPPQEPGVVASAAGGAPGPLSSEPAGAVPRGAPGQAAHELTTRRIDALAAGDGDALRATVADGPLLEETEALASALDSGRTRYAGLAVDVREVQVAEHTGDAATATVRYEVTAHRITTPEGTAEVPAYAQSVELDLRWDGRWSVVRARPLP
ncbi:protein kinase domain-containing protein [Demequina muriae]|uniref:non-specific serine/threonine protein kinase n=1 Tax=Demequina muriae TaxID=3051664 RepID=A0ABT8GJT3_9MICO|nr:protein kinase [Demequina sp. EGI L300058]MDN4481536.1 protein kinase [Demequina sp. EGI L300058]